MLEQAIKFLCNQNKLQLLTRSYRNLNEVLVSFIIDNDRIYVVGRANSVHVEHIKYNPNVVIEVEDQEKRLIIKGLAKILKNHHLKEIAFKDLAEKDSVTPQGIHGLVFIEISMLEMNVQEWNFSQCFPENNPSRLNKVLNKITSSLKFWIRAARLPFVSVSVMGVIVGTAVAFSETGTMSSWLNFVLAFLGITFFHISADISNDFFDHKSGLDESNIQQTPFSGGSRMIQNKLLSPSRTLIAAIISLSLCIAIGFYLNFTVADNIILYIGIGGVFLGIFYVGIPFKLVYYGLGEIAIFLSFGPAIVFGSYYVQNEKFSWKPMYASILVGLLISLILFINQFPDYEADKAKGKKNWVVILGKKRSVIVYVSFMALTYILLILFVILQILPLLSLIVLVSLPLPIIATINAIKNYDNYLAMIPASAMTILTCLAFSILLSVSLFI
ncbi:MAG: 1,4-dihydroxy-2-naphthoate octaprenyltransferase [Candidatus Heimdallarchaeota archaeon]|nr:1,4-dihydroxy-2-naphthoate octaprenyltransferase [Candidatus Heimdallarchaeota archaeon]